jgi:hypothetical protein
VRYRSRGFPLDSRDFKTYACDPRRGVIVRGWAGTTAHLNQPRGVGDKFAEG